MDTNKIFPFVIAVILIGVVGGVGVLVLQQFEENELVSTAGSDNITLLNGTAVSLTNYFVESVTSVYNGSAGPTLGSGNYTVGSTNAEATYGTVTLTGGATFNNTWAIVNYTYGAYSGASTDIDSAEGAIIDFSTDWLPIIIIAMAAVIILALIYGAIGSRRRV